MPDERSPGGRPTPDAFTFALRIDNDAAGDPIPRALRGQNLQWVDGGDDLLGDDGRPRPAMIDKVRALAPTALRFPGGAQSDVYRWNDGVGPLPARRAGTHFHDGKPRASLMGTQEFLELCETLDAEPMITVNVVTGSAAEAAAWLRHVNVDRLRSRQTGRWLPRVPCWEIGNEPYLREGDRRHWLTPTEYVRRANAFIRALRGVDPSIRIGVPLRTATLGGTPVTPMPEFAERVLAGVTERFDFLSLHNAYLPYAHRGLSEPDVVYRATMAATATVERNLADVRELVRRSTPNGTTASGRRLPFAITEYNGLFTLGAGDSDRLILAPVTALYLADLLCMLAGQADVESAYYWSLSGNWVFGALASDGHERPSYRVLELIAPALAGRRLPVRVDGPSFDAPRFGAVAAAPATPLIRALASRDGDTLRLILLNKDPRRTARGDIHLARSRTATVAHRTLRAGQPMRANDSSDALDASESRSPRASGPVSIALAPASVTLMTWHA